MSGRERGHRWIQEETGNYGKIDRKRNKKDREIRMDRLDTSTFNLEALKKEFYSANIEVRIKPKKKKRNNNIEEKEKLEIPLENLEDTRIKKEKISNLSNTNTMTVEKGGKDPQIVEKDKTREAEVAVQGAVNTDTAVEIKNDAPQEVKKEESGQENTDVSATGSGKKESAEVDGVVSDGKKENELQKEIVVKKHYDEMNDKEKGAFEAVMAERNPALWKKFQEKKVEGIEWVNPITKEKTIVDLRPRKAAEKKEESKEAPKIINKIPMEKTEPKLKEEKPAEIRVEQHKEEIPNIREQMEQKLEGGMKASTRERILGLLEKNEGKSYKLQNHDKYKAKLNDMMQENRKRSDELMMEKYIKAAAEYIKEHEEEIREMGIKADVKSPMYAVEVVKQAGKLKEIEDSLSGEPELDEEYKNLNLLKTDLENTKENLGLRERGLLLSALNKEDDVLAKKISEVQTLDEKKALEDKKKELFELRTQLTEKLDVGDLASRARAKMEDAGEWVYDPGNKDEFINNRLATKTGLGQAHQEYDPKWQRIISEDDMKTLNKMGYYVENAGKSQGFWRTLRKDILVYRKADASYEKSVTIEKKTDISKFVNAAKENYKKFSDELTEEYNIKQTEFQKIIEKGKDAVMRDTVAEMGDEGKIKDYFAQLKEKVIDDFITKDLNTRKHKQVEKFESLTGRIDAAKLLKENRETLSMSPKGMTLENTDDVITNFAELGITPKGAKNSEVVKAMGDYYNTYGKESKTIWELLISWATDSKNGMKTFSKQLKG